MTPEICLISVPHSGTMFVREIFVKHGWHEMGLNGQPNPTPTLFQGHCEKASQTLFAEELAKRMPIVMPMRHPYRVEESWRRRGKDISQLLRSYEHMLTVLLPHVKAWVPLDAGPLIRAVNHSHLERVAGKDLEIDWDTLVNAEKGTHDIALDALEPSMAITKIRWHPIFAEFYGDHREEAHEIARRHTAAHDDAVASVSG